ncbi:alpha/beta hydrolase [Granulosicoccaceae sp. 1_MG-2023]|nr:alpha/beta hydrolase [Granulosicoccaceae sp. 1_MG-2023]
MSRVPAIPAGLQPWSQKITGLTIRGWATPPSGKPLIHFLHGNGLCGLTYWPLLSRLRDDFDLVMTDIQGHGDSDTGTRFLGWNRNADVCERLLRHRLQDHDRDQPVYGMGHSLGAVLTTLLSVREPALFDRLLLLDPVYFPRGILLGMAGLSLFNSIPALTPLARSARKRRADWPGRAAAREHLQQRGVYRDWEAEALQAFVDWGMRETDGGVSLKCDPKTEARFFGSYPKGLWRAIKRLNVTTDVVIGENTYPFVLRSVPPLPQINPRFRVTSVPGGHCFMLEDSAATAALVREKLQHGPH